MKFLNIFKKKYKPILEKTSNLGLTSTQLIARDIILKGIEPYGKVNLDNTGINHDSKTIVHAIIVSDFTDINTDNTCLSISLARQIALLCHYPNFDEDTGTNRTKITIINCGSKDNISKISSLLKKETGNLLKLCHWTIDSIHQNNDVKLWIDIEFNLFNLDGDDIHLKIDQLTSDNELISIFHNNQYINTSKLRHSIINFFNYEPLLTHPINEIRSECIYRAFLINLIYQEGINLVQVQGINEIEEYSHPIETFCNYSLDKTIKEWEKEQNNRLKLSSIFCGDCFESRLRCVDNDFFDKINNKDRKNKEQLKIIIQKLAYTEHNRWNVEKLILGYLPYTKEQNYKFYTCYGEEKKRMIKKLKNEGGSERYHVDLRSCNELIRVNKEDIKYDYFLTLCIPHILKREKNKK